MKICAPWSFLNCLVLCICDYRGDFDYCDSIAIVGSTVAILLRYYCDSCDTIAIVVILLST